MIKFLISLFFFPSLASIEYNFSSDKIIVKTFAVIKIILDELSPLIFGVNFNISIIILTNINLNFILLYIYLYYIYTKYTIQIDYQYQFEFEFSF